MGGRPDSDDGAEQVEHLQTARFQMESVGAQSGDVEVRTNLGDLLTDAGVTPAPVNGKNGNGTGQQSGAYADAEFEIKVERHAASTAAANGDASAVKIADAVVGPGPDVKFAFQAWLMLGIFMILKRFLKTADFAALFADGSGPDKERDAEVIHSAWKKLKKLHVACKSNIEAWSKVIVGIVSGVEQKIGGIEATFTFLEAKKMIHALRDVGYGLAWALTPDDRAEVVNTIRRLDRDRAWFGDSRTVRANYKAFLEANRKREEERKLRVERMAAEEARIEELSELGDLLAVAADVGVELTTVVDRETINAAQARLPEVGDMVELKINQLMTGENGNGETFVSGIRFERLPGRREMPFLPARFIPDRWRRLSNETIEQYEQRLKASTANGILLMVEKVEKDERGYYRVLVQIRTLEEVEAIRSCGRKIPFAWPPREIKDGECIDGRVARRSAYGVHVAFPGSVQLFCHMSNIPEGLSLEVGDEVHGIVIPGHGSREFDFAIRERLAGENDEVDEHDERILHPGRVEEIRQYVVDSGMELDEAGWAKLRNIAEVASSRKAISDDEQEAIHTFFEELLKNVEDRKFPSVIMTRREYEEELAEAAEESRGEVDTRPFCVNHTVGQGSHRCDRRVANEGDMCRCCQRHSAQRRPVPGAKKRGVKAKKQK